MSLNSCHMRPKTKHHLILRDSDSAVIMTIPVELHSLKITTSDGLPDNSVYSIYQDRKGFIWFCTPNGLARYDGNNFFIINRNVHDKSLYDNRIKSIHEDKYGLLWVRTTTETYSCYDPELGKFIDYSNYTTPNLHYNSIYEDPDSGIWLYGRQNGCMHIFHRQNQMTSLVYQKRLLGSNCIHFIFYRKKNFIYIGTDETLCLYHNGKIERIANGNFIKAITDGINLFFLTENGKIYKDSGKSISILTTIPQVQKGRDKITDAMAYNDQIFIFSSKGGYHIPKNGKKSIPNSGAWHIPNGHIVNDDEQHPWIYNKTGNLFRINGNHIHPIKMFSSDEVRYIDHERYHIIANVQGLIWISTYGNGLFIMDPKTEEMQHIQAHNDRESWISSNFLLDIIKDRTGGVWVSAEYTGVTQLRIINRGVDYLLPGGEKQSYQSNLIRMIKRLNDSTIEVANRNGWLYTYSQDMKIIKEQQRYKANIYCMMYAPDGTLWTGTKGNGIYVGKQHYVKGTGPNNLSDNDAYCMLTDHAGRIWIGTFGGGLELAVKNSGRYQFKSFFSDLVGLQEVRCLLEDKNGMIWVGTSGGIIVFSPEKLIKNPQSYYLYNIDNGKLTGDEIRWLVQDRQKYIWIAIAGAGIARCNIKNRNYQYPTMRFFDTHDGLVSNKVQSILEDRNNDEWISTEYGVSHFIEKTQRFENYFFSPHIAGNVGSENSALQLSDGRLIFGTSEGLLIINPKMTKKATHPLNITFTGLKINGETATPNEQSSKMNSTIPYSDHITLKYNQNSFTIDLSTLSYENPSTVKYQYRLESYDKKWSTPSTSSTISYKYLHPGSYLLQAKAINAYGINGKISAIKITITPPPYFSWWAFIIYGVIFALITVIIIRIVRHITRLKRQIELEDILTDYKIRFFTNVAHEFRTPLTLILGSLEKINTLVGKKRTSEDIRYSLNIMGKSTHRMLRLTDQLLTFQKIKSNKATLYLERIDMIILLKEIYNTFQDSAISKRITYNFVHNKETYEMYTDKDYIDKIMWNLLSNAFKYTAHGQAITLDSNIDENTGILLIRVIDSGTGITKEQQKELFHRFTQGHYSIGGFGIGLNLTQELVNALKGKIFYEENPNGGSIFCIQLPINKNVYQEKDFKDKHSVLPNDQQPQPVLETDNDPHPVEYTENNNIFRDKTILLVEDDDDVRSFLARELSPFFNTITAMDGKEGLLKAKSTDVSLIISDVLMPGMDGFEFTRKIKNNFEISHIPVILLTALATNENHLQGITSGADAYITKPFSPNLLRAQIFQMLTERERLKRKFSKGTESFSPKFITTEKDTKFIRQLNEIMEKELNNPKFSVNDFAGLMGMGRTLFFRKVKGLSGYTPNEFIRIIRLKKGAEMLKENNYSISEIAYHVGFESPFYFSKCFKEQFGIAPSVYKTNHSSTKSCEDD